MTKFNLISVSIKDKLIFLGLFELFFSSFGPLLFSQMFYVWVEKISLYNPIESWFFNKQQVCNLTLCYMLTFCWVKN